MTTRESITTRESNTTYVWFPCWAMMSSKLNYQGKMKYSLLGGHCYFWFPLPSFFGSTWYVKSSLVEGKRNILRDVTSVYVYICLYIVCPLDIKRKPNPKIKVIRVLNWFLEAILLDFQVLVSMIHTRQLRRRWSIVHLFDRPFCMCTRMKILDTYFIGYFHW